MSRFSVEKYTVGWICALKEEYFAARSMLDEHEPGRPVDLDSRDDNNSYIFGTIKGHGVVIASLPEGMYATVEGALVAGGMVRSFPNLRFALMVGIGGGAPSNKHDIRLGDVVVSTPHEQLGGVVQLDLGKKLHDGSFRLTGHLNRPPPLLLAAVSSMQQLQENHDGPDKIAASIKRMERWTDFKRPAEDRLYQPDYSHQGGPNCQNCRSEKLKVRRTRNKDREIMVHHGTIASSNTVMKNPIERDRYANDPELEVLCFEMEAAGVMNAVPCLVIRGICDYSDSHKNDDWHNYAALTAAAYARELLGELQVPQVNAMRRL
ncbi:uncharacterized protein DFL_006822 [Arthrobotrys flagrans]|uniref:Nucleoside phosphorylase domain-containing protein n=1 Tax=Arthrobotrys flagrans TaxID=97331 RepID=A0A436ZUK1_ARTFL|nr:hypothetical protein DFL_006822 [Arthrobotrys flagrans]